MSNTSESLCPPTPPAAAKAVTQAVASYTAAEEVARARDSATDDVVRYRRLAAAYVDRLGELARDEDELRAMMQAFGAYLCKEGVPPEHIVLCAREVTEHVRLRESMHARKVVESVVRWTIEGYYLERGNPPS